MRLYEVRHYSIRSNRRYSIGVVLPSYVLRVVGYVCDAQYVLGWNIHLLSHVFVRFFQPYVPLDLLTLPCPRAPWIRSQHRGWIGLVAGQSLGWRRVVVSYLMASEMGWL